MTKQNEERKTVFRRIGGRIVPIAIGGGAVYGASKIDANKVQNKLFETNLYKKKPHVDNFALNKHVEQASKKMKILKKIYSKEIKSNLGEDVEIAGRIGKSKPVKFNPFEQSGFSHHSSGLYGIRLKESSSQDFKMRWADLRPNINVANGRESTLLHELGHAQQYRENTKLQKLDVKMRTFDSSHKNRLYVAVHQTFKKVLGTERYWKSAIPNKSNTNFQKKLGRFVNATETKARDIDLDILNYKKEVVRAAHETDAWVRAVKMARPKAKIKIIKEAVKPLSTYFIKPTIRTGKALLAISGISAITYGLLKRD